MKDVARNQMRFLKREVSPQLASMLPKKPPRQLFASSNSYDKIFFLSKMSICWIWSIFCNVGAFAHISEVPSTLVWGTELDSSLICKSPWRIRTISVTGSQQHQKDRLEVGKRHRGSADGLGWKEHLGEPHSDSAGLTPTSLRRQCPRSGSPWPSEQAAAQSWGSRSSSQSHFSSSPTRSTNCAKDHDFHILMQLVLYFGVPRVGFFVFCFLHPVAIVTPWVENIFIRNVSHL